MSVGGTLVLVELVEGLALADPIDGAAGHDYHLGGVGEEEAPSSLMLKGFLVLDKGRGSEGGADGTGLVGVRKGIDAMDDMLDLRGPSNDSQRDLASRNGRPRITILRRRRG